MKQLKTRAMRGFGEIERGRALARARKGNQ